MTAWRAVDGNGRELTFLQDPIPSVPAEGVLGPLVAGGGWPDAWLVIEGPRTGPVTLEYRYDATSEPIVIRIRD